MIAGEDYEVVDEYKEEEEEALADTQNSQLAATSCQELDSTIKQSDSTMDDANQDNPNTNDNIRLYNDKTDQAPIPMEVDYDQKTTNDSIDFTADISLDQLDTQKEITDEDVMHHLDVIENIELDPETFGIDGIDDMDQSIENEVNIFEFSVKEEKEKQKEYEGITTIDGKSSADEEWYEKKIAEKEALVKERLSKLARVLGISYPHYEKWLERVEKKDGSPMCSMDPTRRCPLDKPHTNRWKFECRRKDIQESTKEQSNPDSSDNKSNKTVWCLEPTGMCNVNINNAPEFPSFVLKAVKIFENFLQTTITQDAVSSSNYSSVDIDRKKDMAQTTTQQWLWLLVRCNSKDELMLFATGKNISRRTMDRLKQMYESGPGKNCNVKSLYCKSKNKCTNNKVVTTTTFLVGAEALDETVGTLKVQLAPKTNFWSNTAGALNVAKAVADMLKPTPKVTVLEIGCGIGVIGLMLASKCQQVIGVDSSSEIEEAEITRESNNITNASFIMGSPSDVVNQISAVVKNRAYAIINANTNIGRAVEVMTCLRKITSLHRIVMITMLKKESVRAILELARPIEDELGHPFMPIRACVVDTLPNGSHFEAVIVMERRLMHRLTQPWFLKILEEENKTLENTKAFEKSNNDESTGTQLRKNPLARTELVNKSKPTFMKKLTPTKASASSPVKGKTKLKRELSPEIIEISTKVSKKEKLEKPECKSWQQDVTTKKKNWLLENPTLRINPLFEKKTRENKEQIDLRAKLSSNRIDADLVQKVNASREILEAAKEKLSGPSPTVDASTAKELQNVLSLVLEQANKLPRSVWDRIAPLEASSSTAQVKKELDDDPLLKGRFVQEIHAQDIVITAANKEYLEESKESKPKLPFKKYQNLAPLEPNLIMPASASSKNDDKESHQKLSDKRSRQQNQDNPWNKNRGFDRNRWINTGATRKPVSPMRKQDSSFRYRSSSPRRFSPKRPLLSPPRRPCSPPRRHFSPNRSELTPYQTHDSSFHREYSPQRRSLSPSRRMVSPSSGRRHMTSPRRPFSPSNRSMSPPRHSMSPMRRQMSPSRRHLPSPPRRQMSPSVRMYDSSTRQMSPLRRPMSPMRHRPISPVRRQMSSERRPMSPVGRMVSPSRSRDMMPPRHQSPIRRLSPHRMPPGRAASPLRRQQSPRRQSPLPNRFADEWDIPSRGAIEQSTWQHSVNERQPENVWHNKKQPTTSANWQLSSGNDRYRKSTNQLDRSWDVRDSTLGNSWGMKQSQSTKPPMKELWNQNSDRWSGSGPSRLGSTNDNWNIRGKESLGGGRKESWMDVDKQRWEQPQSNDSWNQGDKDDWNDLPEDARDPWGDEGNLGLKERWMNLENQGTSSNWSKEVDKDPWTKQKDNWQNKSQTFAPKPPIQNSGNTSMSDGSRWLPLNDMNKKTPSTSWQGSANTGTWKPLNYNFQTQRSFNTNLFKDRR